MRRCRRSSPTSSTPIATATRGAGPTATSPPMTTRSRPNAASPHVQQLMTGEPDFVATIMADKVAGLTALYATTMALFHRERTGEGQEVEVGDVRDDGLVHAGRTCQRHAVRAAARARPTTTARSRATAGRTRPRTAMSPRWSTTTSIGTRSSRRCSPPGRRAGREFATLAKRAKRIDEVYGLLGETFLERTTQEWLDLLQRAAHPGAPLRTTDELFDNEQLNAIGFFETVETPQGPMRFPGRADLVLGYARPGRRAARRCSARTPPKCSPIWDLPPPPKPRRSSDHALVFKGDSPPGVELGARAERMFRPGPDTPGETARTTTRSADPLGKAGPVGIQRTRTASRYRVQERRHDVRRPAPG